MPTGRGPATATFGRDTRRATAGVSDEVREGYSRASTDFGEHLGHIGTVLG
jgi:hypothetical protein